MSEIDHYQILGLEANATRADIRRCFRALAMRLHPDQNPDDPGAEERFKLITQAYKILVDPKKRSHYDRTREAARAQRARTAGHARRRAAQRQAASPTGGGKERFAKAATDAKPKKQRNDKPWWEEDKPKTEAPPKPKTVDGEDVHVDMTVSSEIAELGGRQPLAVARRLLCETCDGTGAKPGTKIRRCPECDPDDPSASCHFCSGRGRLLEAFCPDCGGEGKARLTKNLLVTIPARSQSGHLLRVPGEGLPSRKGGKPGDLVIHLKVKAVADYEQRDSAVYSEVHITPSMAALGGMVRVKTVDGSAELVIPPGTRSGTVFRLEGKGPVIKGKERGDHYVTVKIVAV